jgi:hypothetical protein
MKASSPNNTIWPRTAADKKLMASLGRQMFQGVVEYETATGRLDPTPKNLLKLIRTLKRRLDAGKMEWTTATDFRLSLLCLARKAKSEEDWEMSCLYYGTWLEHQLNNLIHLWLMRKGGTDRYAEILMKESGVRGKLLWLYLCVTGRVVPIKQLNKLIALAERRNQFVHYKWTMRSPDADGDDHYQRAARSAESLVRFLDRFEQKSFLKKAKAFFRKL